MEDHIGFLDAHRLGQSIQQQAMIEKLKLAQVCKVAGFAARQIIVNQNQHMTVIGQSVGEIGANKSAAPVITTVFRSAINDLTFASLQLPTPENGHPQPAHSISADFHNLLTLVNRTLGNDLYDKSVRSN